MCWTLKKEMAASFDVRMPGMSLIYPKILKMSQFVTSFHICPIGFRTTAAILNIRKLI